MREKERSLMIKAQKKENLCAPLRFLWFLDPRYQTLSPRRLAEHAMLWHWSTRSCTKARARCAESPSPSFQGPLPAVGRDKGRRKVGTSERKRHTKTLKGGKQPTCVQELPHRGHAHAQLLQQAVHIGQQRLCLWGDVLAGGVVMLLQLLGGGTQHAIPRDQSPEDR